MKRSEITVRQGLFNDVDICCNGWIIAIVNGVINVSVEYKDTKRSRIFLYDKDGYLGLVIGVFDYGQPGIGR